MASKWIAHVKAFAKKNKLNYPTALAHPDVKKGYVPVTPGSKPRRKKSSKKKSSKKKRSSRKGRH
tara:strand:+ start:519 stop:713 length:195 start_codon:yes stop_codon:yes gene_type:complete